MLDILTTAISDTFHPRLQPILFKSIGLAVVFILLFGFGLSWMLGVGSHFGISTLAEWIGLSSSSVAVESAGGFMDWLIMAIVVALSVFMIIPVTMLVSSIFLDDVADKLEGHYYPENLPARKQSLGEVIGASLKFFVLVMAVNILAFLLYLIPILNVGIFFIANGFLLSREYFNLIAQRHLDQRQILIMRQTYRGQIFIAGLIIAMIISIPIINLFVPIFGTCLFAHLYHHFMKNHQAGSNI